MSLHYPKPNHNHAAEYQCSGVPYALHIDDVDTGAPQKVSFPYVTRWIQVYAHDQDIRVGFTANGVAQNPAGTKNFIVVEAGKNSGRLELKCRDIFLAADSANNGEASIVAGLTNVVQSQFLSLTGSAGIGGVG